MPKKKIVIFIFLRRKKLVFERFVDFLRPAFGHGRLGHPQSLEYYEYLPDSLQLHVGNSSLNFSPCDFRAHSGICKRSWPLLTLTSALLSFFFSLRPLLFTHFMGSQENKIKTLFVVTVVFFLIFRASVRSRPLGPTLVPGVYITRLPVSADQFSIIRFPGIVCQQVFCMSDCR